jgi:hypothetical protein
MSRVHDPNASIWKYGRTPVTEIYKNSNNFTIWANQFTRKNDKAIGQILSSNPNHLGPRIQIHSEVGTIFENFNLKFHSQNFKTL